MCRVLSAFEESSAACISDMLRQVSNGQYLDAIRMAEKFILHVEVLFATIDDLEYHFARLGQKGLCFVQISIEVLPNFYLQECLMFEKHECCAEKQWSYSHCCHIHKRLVPVEWE